MFHIENAYKFPNLKVVGRTCCTNIPSNTAFRGFGGPQGMFVGETIIDEIAAYLGLGPNQVNISLLMEWFWIQGKLIGERIIHIDEIATYLGLGPNQVNISLLMEWFDHRVSL